MADGRQVKGRIVGEVGLHKGVGEAVQGDPASLMPMETFEKEQILELDVGEKAVATFGSCSGYGEADQLGA